VRRRSRRAARLRWLAALALPIVVVAIGACGPSAERREAERIAAAVDKLRAAEHAERGPLLDRLEKDHADSELAERARLDCTKAFRALHDAKEKVAEVERAVAAHSKKGTVPPAELLQTLETAQKMLDEANGAMPACSKAMADLKIRLR
jgi:hypothetical protein